MIQQFQQMLEPEELFCVSQGGSQRRTEELEVIKHDIWEKFKKHIIILLPR